MEPQGNSGDKFWLYAVPLLAQQGRASFVQAAQKILLNSWMLYAAIGLVTLLPVIICWTSPGGTAWGKLRRKCTIPGPWGLPVIGSLLEMGTQAHRRLAALAKRHNAESLMAISLGKTRVIIASKPEVAREILNSSCFADRPLKQSAQELLFGRAIGFAPQGEYWRGLRRIASNHLFTPKRISAHEPFRQHETNIMIRDIAEDTAANGGVVQIRRYLQRASLNNIMWSVFGRGYDFHGSDCLVREAEELQSMVREGFDLLGAFNWADHLTLLRAFDSHHIHERCRKLVPRVNAFVQKIIDEHRLKSFPVRSETDFVDVLLSLQGEERLADADIVAVLWEMIFRGTDTTAILTEWILAELILHPDVQEKIHAELDLVVGSAEIVKDADVHKLTYLQAAIKETLRLHPPGPLLSWARLSTEDAFVAGHHVPKGTTAMVNMWAITHDPAIWNEPEVFKPGRFLASEGGADVDVKGNDLRLAPFGSGRRVCPGRVLGLATVQLWVARLMHQFVWHPSPEHPVVLKEVLKLSCEMDTPLTACPVPRSPNTK